MNDLIYDKIERITYVWGDDWVVIYVNGKSWFQGHSVPTFGWLELLAQVHGTVKVYEAEYDLLIEDSTYAKFGGSYPETESELLNKGMMLRKVL